MNIFNPFAGTLTVTSSLIIYIGGFYSLDGGITVSENTIGPDTQIIAAASVSISITLQSAAIVDAKLISVPGGSLTITGPGILRTDNQDVIDPTASRVFGVRVLRDLTVRGGATLYGTGRDYGVASSSSVTGITVTEGSTLFGAQTGVNTSITNASRYGVYSYYGITVSEGGRIEGIGIFPSYNTYGVFANSAHNESYPVRVTSGTVTGTGDVGIYSGSAIIVDVGSVTGIGGFYVTSHGVQADRTGIIVNPGGQLTGLCSGSAYAGVLTTAGTTVSGITVNGGELDAEGGVHGVRAAGTGSILVSNGGTMTGSGSSYGVFCLNNNITVNNSGRVTGTLTTTGGRDGVFAGGNITATENSVVEGFVYAYGLDGSGFFGAVIANENISAADISQIIENYSRIEYFDEVFTIPYQNGKNMTNYLNYTWAISTGTGAVSSDPGGQGIHATQSGEGTLTSTRIGNIASEVVALDAVSLHTINIPVVLSVVTIPEYIVTYNGNGATDGNVPIDLSNPYYEGDTVTVLGNTGVLTRTGFTFAGWTMNQDGSGIVYQAGETFLMPANNVMLYALWEEEPAVFVVTYDANGATNGIVPVDPSNPYHEEDIVTVLGNTGGLSRAGFTFVGWSMNQDGSGIVYRVGDTFRMPPSNVTLYALWESKAPPTIPPCKPCCCCCHCCCREHKGGRNPRIFYRGTKCKNTIR